MPSCWAQEVLTHFTVAPSTPWAGLDRARKGHEARSAGSGSPVSLGPEALFPVPPECRIQDRNSAESARWFYLPR